MTINKKQIKSQLNQSYMRDSVKRLTRNTYFCESNNFINKKGFFVDLERRLTPFGLDGGNYTLIYLFSVVLSSF